jgi:hypothetical protein
MRRSTVRYGRSPHVDHDMDTGSPLFGFSLSNNRSTKSLAPILFSMGYGCFLPYLRAGNRNESHLPGDELRRGRIIPDIEAGQINPSFIITHTHGPCAFPCLSSARSGVRVRTQTMERGSTRPLRSVKLPEKSIATEITLK